MHAIGRVEVGMNAAAHQRMQLDRLAFDQYRLKRLDSQAVQLEHDSASPDVPYHDPPEYPNSGNSCSTRRLAALIVVASPSTSVCGIYTAEKLQRHFLRQPH